MVQPLHVESACIYDPLSGQALPGSLYTSRAGRIVPAPAPDALLLGLDGYTLYPALVNAHDHLELNHFPRSRFREAYSNAHVWGEDVNARLNESPYRAGRAVPLADRLFFGALKNLLCGALTVAHHNPPHRALFRRDFPVRVLRRYGWTHSLHFSSEEDIRASYRSTPPGAPWFIHLAEGTDDVAAGEYRRLLALGCAGPNTVIVHGVGMTRADVSDAARRVRGLVWCPSSNRYLLGRTADADAWIAAGGVIALGSDSRLTADGDLLDELRAAGGGVPRLVTAAAATLLGLADAGHLHPGAQADWIALPADRPLAEARRADLALIVRGGVPQIGDAELMLRFPGVPSVSAILDGVPKRIHADLARRIARCTLSEPGLWADVRWASGRRWP